MTDENEAPLVAFRPVGAGRTAVFTGEADGDLAGLFARWEHAPELHASLLAVLRKSPVLRRRRRSARIAAMTPEQAQTLVGGDVKT